ncbi:hypothetical protein D777_03326 [Marinobacter nitratireducens]|uniref:Uncharacterized protein n=1 Tax=Marinobacter nitratireducens TaxID=1137280 RepID=A0A072NAT7_9GAMM|nr:hypothetical protein D777_03326 [Marinobacter nitratireducens]
MADHLDHPWRGHCVQQSKGGKAIRDQLTCAVNRKHWRQLLLNDNDSQPH